MPDPNRGRRFHELSKLQAAVRATCLDKFERRFRKPWNPGWESLLRGSDAPGQTERRARALHEKLRGTMVDVVTFAKQGDWGGGCAQFLRWWAPQFLEPLLTHASMQPGLKWIGDPKLDARPRLVDLLENIDLFRSDRRPSALDAKDYAIVSLLAGNWPTTKTTPMPERGLKVADILEAEAATFARHIRVYGRNLARRGPRRSKTKKSSRLSS